jgi:glycosyltransferase involved in cell wall biosynthesis
MISLVVPTYKERANLERLVKRTGDALSHCGEEFELIIVDDASPDGTPDEVRRLAAQNRPWLRLLVRENERDLSTAVIAGWRIARGDVLGCMDADLQHPPEMLPKLVAELRRSGAEIVVGSRHVPGGGVTHIPVESLRLKYDRDALVDIEYGLRLQAQGDGNFLATNVLLYTSDVYTYDADPAHFRALRQTLGQKVK